MAKKLTFKHRVEMIALRDYQFISGHLQTFIYPTKIIFIMPEIQCAECGREFEVNFVPREDRAYYCDICKQRLVGTTTTREELLEQIRKKDRCIQKVNLRILVLQEKLALGLNPREKAKLDELRAEYATLSRDLAELYHKLGK